MHLYVQISFDFPCITGLAFTWVYYSNIAILYVHRQCLCVQDTAFTVCSAASVSESASQRTERLYDVLPNQQGHQVLYRTTCYVGCGNLPDFPLQYCTLIALVFGEALW